MSRERDLKGGTTRNTASTHGREIMLQDLAHQSKRDEGIKKDK
jgi:hypothetical protein